MPRRIVAIVFALAVPAVSAQVASPEGFAVGLVRADGFMHPVATWRDDGWQALTAAARQVPRDGWRFVPSSSDVARPLAIEGIVTTPSHCVQVEGFATDAPRRDEATSSPRLKAGVAVRGDLPFERPEDVASQPDQGSRRAAALVVRIVQALEADTIRGERGVRLRALVPSVRAAGIVRLAQFRRAATPDESQYFFEARKEYRGLRDHVFVSGWLSQTRWGDVRIETLRSWVAGRAGETTMVTSTVHGVIRQARYRLVWLLEDHAYEGESYSLVDLGAGGRVLTVSGGGC